MNITAILVDDERKSLTILKNKLSLLCPNVTIIGATQSPQKGIHLIEKLKPQLVFLDVAMPEISGFDLLAEIKHPAFEIIFVTAFDHYAIEAISHCAIGYLLKPVDDHDLIATINKAINNIEDKVALKKNRLLIENLGEQIFQNKKTVIPTQDGLEIATLKDIVHCKGVDGYTQIYFIKKKPILSSYSIGHFYKSLENQGFYLVHKSHLINLAYIDKYLNEGSVLLTNNYKIPVSKNKRIDFLNSLKEDFE